MRCLTVANTLSIGLDVRKWARQALRPRSQCLAGTSWKVSSASWSLARQVTAFSYVAPYFPANVAMAASGVAPSGAFQT